MFREFRRKIPFSGVLGRWSTINYELTKVFSVVESIGINPVFTEDDYKKKLEIFEIPNHKTCFISGEKSKGRGDHIYEINGYYKYTQLYGIDDRWNTVPVKVSLNKGYKKLKFIMNGKQIEKDIGYQDLTEEELTFFIRE